MFVERAFEVKYFGAASSLHRRSESVTPLRKNESMTATAIAFDPVPFDPFLDEADLEYPRPHLRIIEGEGRATDAAALAPPQSTPASVEIYRRRRFFALLAVTALVLVAAFTAGIPVTGFATTAPNAHPDQPRVHVVVPGDSYGAIAAELGAADPVVAAAALRAANGGGELVVGQRLVVDLAEPAGRPVDVPVG